jgi:hypothetical protein
MTTYTVTTPETRRTIQAARSLRSRYGALPEYDQGLLDLVYSLTGIPRSELIPQLNMDAQRVYGCPLELVDQQAFTLDQIRRPDAFR